MCDVCPDLPGRFRLPSERVARGQCEYDPGRDAPDYGDGPCTAPAQWGERGLSVEGHYCDDHYGRMDYAENLPVDTVWDGVLILRVRGPQTCDVWLDAGQCGKRAGYAVFHVWMLSRCTRHSS